MPGPKGYLKVFAYYLYNAGAMIERSDRKTDATEVVQLIYDLSITLIDLISFLSLLGHGSTGLFIGRDKSTYDFFHYFRFFESVPTYLKMSQLCVISFL